MKRPDRRRKEPQNAFNFLGFQDGWYSLRATSEHKLENQVIEWLIEQRITVGSLSWIGNGTVYADRPALPVSSDGSQFAVLFKRPADVMRFELAFPCRGITPQTMLDAIRSEASKFRLTIEDVARIAYEAARALSLVVSRTGRAIAHPEWDQLEAENQIHFIEDASLQLTNPKLTARDIHDARHKTRPFDRLTSVEKVKSTLFTTTVMTLIPLLD